MVCMYKTGWRSHCFESSPSLSTVGCRVIEQNFGVKTAGFLAYSSEHKLLVHQPRQLTNEILRHE
jgi:hypothetical protein